MLRALNDLRIVGCPSRQACRAASATLLPRPHSCRSHFPEVSGFGVLTFLRVKGQERRSAPAGAGYTHPEKAKHEGRPLRLFGDALVLDGDYCGTEGDAYANAQGNPEGEIASSHPYGQP